MSVEAFTREIGGRLLARRVVTAAGCWVWATGKRIDGYGVTYFKGAEWRLHRAAYVIWRGPIADGLQIDHLCRNRACFNPSHLECVTSRENTLRGEGITARAARATHCPAGHPYNEINTYRTPKGHRDCRACRRAAGARRNAKRRAA